MESGSPGTLIASGEWRAGNERKENHEGWRDAEGNEWVLIEKDAGKMPAVRNEEREG
jgi:hypothetical protein